MPDRWIVVTSINPPTAAILAFQALTSDGWRVVVVGDTKTPADWKCEGVDFLSVSAQKELFPKVAELIPYRHYCRKNIGYLYALGHGAQIILDTDDDNIPYPSFGRDISRDVSGQILRAQANAGWVNIYRHFTPVKSIWPRGLPLDAIEEEGTLDSSPSSASCSVQQFLADEDPDVDAIYRLTGGPLLNFNPDAPAAILAPNTFVPFNSQNTIFFKEAFPLLYLPCFVSFRMTDIWRSFVAQVALWSTGGTLCFKSSTVKQVRNAHNLMRDFEDEIPGYLHNRRIMQILVEAATKIPPLTPLAAVALDLWTALLSHQIITPAESQIVQAWLDALSEFSA